MRAYEYLPHKTPFVLLDSAEVTEEGRRGRGVKAVTIDDPCVDEGGVLAEVFVLEAMAQLSGIVSGRREGGYLSALRDVQFHCRAAAGAPLVIESEIETSMGGLYSFRCEASQAGRLVARARVMLSLGAGPA